VLTAPPKLNDHEATATSMSEYGAKPVTGRPLIAVLFYMNANLILTAAATLAVGIALGAFMAVSLIKAEVAKLSCGLYMSLGDSVLVVEGEKSDYRVYVNGMQIWPRGRDHLAVYELEAPSAEVRVEAGAEAGTLYVTRLPNGTYVFAWNNRTAKKVCIP